MAKSTPPGDPGGDPSNGPFRATWQEVVIFALAIALIVFLILNGSQDRAAVVLVVFLVGALFSALLFPRSIGKAVSGIAAVSKSLAAVAKELHGAHRRAKQREADHVEKVPPATGSSPTQDGEMTP